MKIFHSASRIVFILLTFALVVLTFTGKVEAKDFITLTGMAFVHFFNKSQNEDNNISEDKVVKNG